MSLQKILVISPAWVGDMVMTQALLKKLFSQHPHALISVLANKPLVPLIERMKEVSEVITVNFKHGELKLGERYRLGKSLRERNFDQVIVAPNSLKSALVPFFARIPKRTGWRGEWRYGLLNDVRVLDEQTLPLMVQQLLALGQAPDSAVPEHRQWRPQLSVTDEQIAQTNAALGIEAPKKPVLGICPGAAFGEAKRWPTEYFAQVALSMLKKGWDVWLFGSEADLELGSRIMQSTQNQCTNFIGKTTLGQAIDCLAQTTRVLANDSGLMHIAAALDKPVMVLYGSSSPDFTPPLSDQATILRLDLECSPCFERSCPLGHLRCMKDLTPQTVLGAL